MKKSKTAIVLRLQERGCYHSVIWQLVKSTAQKQEDHNREMEKQYASSSNHRDALMQQQFANGVHAVLDVMASFERMHDKDFVSLFLYPLDPDHSPQWPCGQTAKLKRAVEAFQKVMDGK